MLGSSAAVGVASTPGGPVAHPAGRGAGSEGAGLALGQTEGGAGETAALGRGEDGARAGARRGAADGAGRPGRPGAHRAVPGADAGVAVLPLLSGAAGDAAVGGEGEDGAGAVALSGAAVRAAPTPRRPGRLNAVRRARARVALLHLPKGGGSGKPTDPRQASLFSQPLVKHPATVQTTVLDSDGYSAQSLPAMAPCPNLPISATGTRTLLP